MFMMMQKCKNTLSYWWYACEIMEKICDVQKNDKKIGTFFSKKIQQQAAYFFFFPFVFPPKINFFAQLFFAYV